MARERVGEELSKMIKGDFISSIPSRCPKQRLGRDPLRSIELIHNLSLYDPIFFAIPEAFSSSLSGIPSSSRTGLAAASILRYILEPRADVGPKLPKPHPLYYQALQKDLTCSPRLYLAAVLTPYKRLTYRDKKNKDQLLVELVIRESLKLGAQSHFLDGIPLLFAACDIIAPAVADPSKLRPTSERVGIGAGIYTLTFELN